MINRLNYCKYISNYINAIIKVSDITDELQYYTVCCI